MKINDEVPALKEFESNERMDFVFVLKNVCPHKEALAKYCETQRRESLYLFGGSDKKKKMLVMGSKAKNKIT